VFCIRISLLFLFSSQAWRLPPLITHSSALLACHPCWQAAHDSRLIVWIRVFQTNSQPFQRGWGALTSVHFFLINHTCCIASAASLSSQATFLLYISTFAIQARYLYFLDSLCICLFFHSLSSFQHHTINECYSNIAK
jgi:hypothetical protein